MQINIDENAKSILEKEKDAMRERGISGASLSDAIRSINMRLFTAEANLRTFRELHKKGYYGSDR